MIAREMRGAPERPQLRLVRQDEPADDANAQAPGRSLRYRLIRDIARLHGLSWLVRRETAAVNGVVERLQDTELIALHNKLLRAQECILDGVGFDEAGLL